MPCIGNVPAIVASGSFNQSGPLSATTLFTPTVTGIYRISVYAVGSNTDGIGASLAWTDENRSQSVSPINLNGAQEIVAVAHAVASSNIQLSSGADVTDTVTYRYVVEQLA